MDSNDPIALAAASLQRGHAEEALRLLASVLARQPGLVPALGLQANAALLAGQPALAVQALRRLLALQPAQPALRRVLSQALNRLGSEARRARRTEEAERAFAEALEHWDGNTEARFNLALGFMSSRRHREALPHWQRLHAQAPADPEVAIELASALALAAKFRQARELLAGMEMPGDLPDALRIRQVEALLVAGDAPGAERAAGFLARKDGPHLAGPLASLAEKFAHAGASVPARALYRHAAALRGDGAAAPGLRDLIASRLALPAIVIDASDIAVARKQFVQGMEDLHSQLDHERLGRCERSLAQLAWSNFFLAYHGENDLALQSSWGDLLSQLAARLCPPLPRPARRADATGQARIALVSSCFRECTAGAYFGSWPRLLAELGHEVHVFQLGPHFDATTAAIGQAPAMLHRIEGGADELAGALAEAACDLIIYPELGMDARLLPVAALRLAPRQACAWGHPVTSGLPTMDGCFSCADMEPADAQAHYRERLHLLPGLGTRYRVPTLPPAAGRAELGLPDDVPLYLLPHSLFKLHPDNDAVFAAIAAADRDGVLVLFEGEGEAMRAPFLARLGAALRAAGADPDRQLLVLPMMDRERFLQVNQACDVMVDSLYWSGGNTSLDALLSGLPIVTRPGLTMRARQSMAMLRRIGLDELVVATPDELVARALAVARDPGYRARLSQHIRDHLDVLFDSSGLRDALAAHIDALLVRP
ncbi:hypothetical protein [Pseudofulvimonas gallinarii]|uniref:protein O-GlcNAc transferase n=1 Tax=Pseudofulvimonas gallinarii TaxID=634155 RepID=A0A4R3LKP6_9GAMM|nr:hypothetical protein [Pseudofulvimonas gallinarii]TCT00774.1 CRISPR-associated protein Csy1 [Pseudofulvimonas gallinarii]THD12810.1 hypothetical protein B1808_10925 [Pseudofulvimonas gallinarii]